MKVLTAIGIVLLGLLLFYAYAAGRSERIARFINFKMDLKSSQLERQASGTFTNRSGLSTISAWTNQYLIGGTNYQCELVGENDGFTNWGTLAITTNGVFLWIDRKHGVIPLLGPGRTLPPEL